MSTRQQRIHILISLIFLFLFSCLPESGSNTTSSDSDPADTVPCVEIAQNSTLPYSFTKKAVIEDWTATWCGYCPDGFARIQTIESNYPGRVYAVAHHSNDSLSVNDSLSLGDDLGGINGIPAGAVNRTVYPSSGDVILNRGYWSTVVESLLSTGTNSVIQYNDLPVSAECGLRVVTTLSGSTGTARIDFGFTSDPSENVSLSVFVLEDGVTGYSQSNYYNDDATSPYYGLGNPISGFEHNHVLRKFVTPVEGDLVFSGGDTETVYYIEYTFSIDGSWDSDNLSVLAMLHRSGSGAGEHVILNAQKAALGGTHDWD